MIKTAHCSCVGVMVSVCVCGVAVTVRRPNPFVHIVCVYVCDFICDSERVKVRDCLCYLQTDKERERQRGCGEG